MYTRHKPRFAKESAESLLCQNIEKVENGRRRLWKKPVDGLQLVCQFQEKIDKLINEAKNINGDFN